MVSHLAKVQRDIHLIVAKTPGQRGTLPPALCPVHSVGHRVGFVRVIGVAVAAVLTLMVLKVGERI